MLNQSENSERRKEGEALENMEGVGTRDIRSLFSRKPHGGPCQQKAWSSIWKKPTIKKVKSKRGRKAADGPIDRCKLCIAKLLKKTELGEEVTGNQTLSGCCGGKPLGGKNTETSCQVLIVNKRTKRGEIVFLFIKKRAGWE